MRSPALKRQKTMSVKTTPQSPSQGLCFEDDLYDIGYSYYDELYEFEYE